MCSSKTVFFYAPELIIQELNPMMFKVCHLGSLIQCDKGHKGGEAFIEPEIIPPLHSDEVAEPHVRQLMEIGTGETQSFSKRWNFSTEQVTFVVCDTTNILHRAKVMLRHKDLVILVEMGTQHRRILSRT
jgi:hypothetical protein